jgi:hypothetical protein
MIVGKFARFRGAASSMLYDRSGEMVVYLARL